MPNELPPTNWRPWQIQPLLLLMLAAIAAAVAAVLEILVQQGNKSYSSTQLLSRWDSWCVSQVHTEACRVPKHLSVLNASTSIQGVLGFIRPSDMATGPYFLCLYFPSILAILYGICWQTIDSEIKRIEPFYQTSRAGGVLARSTIFSEYISLPSFLSPFQAMRWRQWAVVLSSSIYTLVGTVTPVLQAQMFQVQTQLMQVGYMTTDDFFGTQPPEDYWSPSTLESSGYDWGNLTAILWTDPANDEGFQGLHVVDRPNSVYTDGSIENVIYLQPAITRSQEAVLLLVAILAVILAVLLRRRQTGMVSPHRGIGALTSLASANVMFLNRLSIESSASSDRTTSSMRRPKDCHVCLGWNISHNELTYGFSWIEPSIEPQRHRCWTRRPEWLSYSREEAMRWVTILSLFTYVFLIGLLFGMGKLKAKDPRSAEERILHAQGDSDWTVAILVVSAVGKSAWKVVDHEAVTITPFRDLVQAPQPAWPSLGRDYASMPIGIVTIYAFLDSKFMLAAITFVSVLLEASLLCLAIVMSMNQGQGYNDKDMFLVTYIGLALSGTAIIMVIFILHRLRKGPIALPRNPSNLAAQMLYFKNNLPLQKDMKPLHGFECESERKQYLQNLQLHYSLSS